MEWLNYHHLLHFWLVVREGSVRAASEALHVTPATVSFQVRQLERSLGVKLLEKQGRQLYPTPMGEQVAAYASEIFATGRELMDLVRGRPVGQPLEFRVGVRDSMPKLVAFDLLRPALGLQQPLRLVCQEGDMPHLMADLANHRLDLVLTDAPVDPVYGARAHSRLLGESGLVVMAVAALASRYRPDFPHSLDGAPFVLPTESGVLRRTLQQWFSENGLRPLVRGEFADSAMMKIAGQAGLGLVAIPAIIREHVESMYGMETVGELPQLKESFYAVSMDRKVSHPGVIAVTAALSAADGAGKTTLSFDPAANSRSRTT